MIGEGCTIQSLEPLARRERKKSVESVKSKKSRGEKVRTGESVSFVRPIRPSRRHRLASSARHRINLVSVSQAIRAARLPKTKAKHPMSAVASLSPRFGLDSVSRLSVCLSLCVSPAPLRQLRQLRPLRPLSLSTVREDRLWQNTGWAVLST